MVRTKRKQATRKDDSLPSSPPQQQKKHKVVDERYHGSSSRGGAASEHVVVDPRFINETAEEVYNKVLRSEKLKPSMAFYWPNILNSDYGELFEDFRRKRIFDVVGFIDDVYEDLVREFYANLSSLGANDRLYGLSLKTRVKGKEIELTEAKLCAWFKMSCYGIRPTVTLFDCAAMSNDEENEDDQNFDPEIGQQLVRRLAVVGNRNDSPLEAMDIPIHYRLIHYAVNRNLYPKWATHNYISNLDLEIIWNLEQGNQINFPHLMLRMMIKRTRQLQRELHSKTMKKRGLPYGPYITKILKEHGVNLSGERSIQFPHNWRVTTMNLKTMKIMKTIERGWMYGPHARTFGLTPIDAETMLSNESQRHRSSSARKSHANVREVRREIGSLRGEIEKLHTRMSALEKLMEKVLSVVDKIWDKMSCKNDDGIARSWVSNPVN